MRRLRQLQKRSSQIRTSDPIFETLDAKIASSLEKIIPKFALQKEGLSRKADGSKRSTIPSRKTDRFYDL